MQRNFATKQAAREAVWNALAAEGVARFPFPVRGRIPNFAGAGEAAGRLFSAPQLARAGRIKVNPDSPQKFVRQEALRRGITVFMPTPRLRGGFKRLDPERIPEEKFGEAANLTSADRWAEPVRLEELPGMDVIVTGSVVVTRDGRRCGKGHGYGDLEYAILRELEHPPVPVATTVHPLQIVDSFPTDAHDLPIALIATPDELIEVADPPEPPGGIDWSALSDELIHEMRVLEDVRRMKA